MPSQKRTKNPASKLRGERKRVLIANGFYKCATANDCQELSPKNTEPVTTLSEISIRIKTETFVAEITGPSCPPDSELRKTGTGTDLWHKERSEEAGSSP